MKESGKVILTGVSAAAGTLLFLNGAIRITFLEPTTGHEQEFIKIGSKLLE